MQASHYTANIPSIYPKTPKFLALVSQMAKLGDYRNIYHLGLLYLNGIQVNPYPEEARFWLKKAYEKHPDWFTPDLINFIQEHES